MNETFVRQCMKRIIGFLVAFSINSADVNGSSSPINDAYQEEERFVIPAIVTTSEIKKNKSISKDPTKQLKQLWQEIYKLQHQKSVLEKRLNELEYKHAFHTHEYNLISWDNRCKMHETERPMQVTKQEAVKLLQIKLQPTRNPIVKDQ